MQELVVAARLYVDRRQHFVEDPQKINGLKGELVYTVDIKQIGDYCHIEEVYEHGTPITMVYLKNFPPGKDILEERYRYRNIYRCISP